MTLDFHPQARDELDEAIAGYESIQPGLGLDLLAQVEAACLRVLAFPAAWPFLSPRCRQAVLPRFPYSLVFRVDAEAVLVLALAHHKRHPRNWKNRV